MFAAYNTRNWGEYKGLFAPNAETQINYSPLFLSDGNIPTAVELRCISESAVFLLRPTSIADHTAHMKHETSISDEDSWRSRYVQVHHEKPFPMAVANYTRIRNGVPLEVSAHYKFNHHCAITVENKLVEQGADLREELGAVQHCFPPINEGI